MYIGTRSGLSAGQLLRCLVAPAPAAPRDLIVTGSGSDALRLALRGLAIQPGERILIPSYVCDVVPQAIRAEGVHVQYYPVEPAGLGPDWNALPALAGGCRAALVVHYFGFPQDLDRWTAFCRSHDMLLIEDCAHALGSSYRTRALGTIGDAGIFSFRKLLACPDGGGVCFKDLRAPIRSHAETSFPASVISWAKMMLMGLSDVVGTNLHDVRRTHHTVAGSAGAPAGQSECRAPSYATEWFVRSAGLLWAVERRRNYHLLESALDSQGSTAVWRTLEEGVIPMALPLRLTKECAERIAQGGLGTYRWPRLPKEVALSDAVAATLAQEMLLVPVHQGLRSRHLRQLVQELTAQLKAVND